ncbi:hypothetical protein [Rhodoferax sp.]|uniref:hypothetical protein n=1 Tax=Rhodoferax sp. TaxID=50421 RepID=UPI00374D75BD
MHQQIHFNGKIRRAAIILAAIFLAAHGAEYLDAGFFSDSPRVPAEKQTSSTVNKPVATPAADAALHKTGA